MKVLLFTGIFFWVQPRKDEKDVKTQLEVLQAAPKVSQLVATAVCVFANIHWIPCQ